MNGQKNETNMRKFDFLMGIIIVLPTFGLIFVISNALMGLSMHISLYVSFIAALFDYFYHLRVLKIERELAELKKQKSIKS